MAVRQEDFVLNCIPRLLLAVLCLIAMQAQAGFATQGIVTGRIYDRLDDDPGILDEFQNMGLGWIRLEFEEFMNQGQLGYEDPAVLARRDQYRRIIAAAHARGIKVLGVVGFNSMPSNTGFPDTEASIQRYVQALRWHLEQYGVDAVEIWNEPHGTGFAGKLNRYSRLLIASYQLKPHFPAVLFIGPATANAERGTWLGLHGPYGNQVNYEDSIFNSQAMLDYRAAHEGTLPFDRISWHPYGTGGDPGGDFYYGRPFAEYYDEILDYRDRQGRPIATQVPIWFTEYGWDSNLVGEELQRIYQEKIVAQFFARDRVELPFLYNYADDEPGPTSEGKAFGIRYNRYGAHGPKRVYYSFIAHSNLAGLFTEDGANEWVIDEITAKYMQQGRDSLGFPYRHPYAPWYGDKAHYWGPDNNGVIQQFNGGAIGECGLLKKNDAAVAYLLKGGFYRYYIDHGGPYELGWPLSDEYWDDAAQAVVQRFELGYLRWRPGEAVSWQGY